MKPIKHITVKNFEKYGSVLEFPEDSTESFYIAEKEEKSPWRLAVFRYDNKSIHTMECHPTSKESFEPLYGVTILVVAEHERPDEYEAFVLDKPICLKKGIWHQVLALTEKAQVKITENLEVESSFYDLREAISVQMV